MAVIAVMDIQQFSIRGHAFPADDPALQAALAQMHDTPDRPRCLCVPGGVEMYVAHHSQFVVKRMPDTGPRHHPTCPSFEAEPGQSGLGELLGDAVIEAAPGNLELRVDFPLWRSGAHAVPRGEPEVPAEVSEPHHRMSLHALLHWLFERAGFNRWSPAMLGKRNQGVLHKYLLEAALNVWVKGLPLADRLYVSEPFSEEHKADAARRRREKLAVLAPQEGHSPLVIVIGEFKACDVSPLGCRLWIKHMPDAPLLLTVKTWDRLQRVFSPLWEAMHADVGSTPRLMLAALIRARCEHSYEIDTASLMLTSEQWIPVEGVFELPLVQALVQQQRRFVKPLRYDARSAAGFANALLLDVGVEPVPLHVLSAFMAPKDQAAKLHALKAAGEKAWVWNTGELMPAFPMPVPRVGA